MKAEMNFEICFLACVVLSFKHCSAESLEEYKVKYVNNILECSKEFPITSEDILTLRKKELPEGDNVKCLLACSYKKSGMMDADGKLSPEGIQKISDEVFADQPELKKRSEDFTNACIFVNDENITGDKKDCDRAAMIFKCSVERAAEALTDEEIKVEFTKYVMKCQKDYPVEVSELMALQNFVIPKNKETKCLLACAYKAEGSMTAKGLYDLEHGYKVAELTKNGDEKRFANAKKLADLCSKVNDEPVTDGEKGCDRAALMFKCLVQNAPKLGFKL
ncbi:uncharacterized protein [Choristoneura fumiferana]|uniref:uncharacterized protein n=1 Tax=Choristoneura fumiferana TaxID=7141 RepID=UPI003D153E66